MANGLEMPRSVKIMYGAIIAAGDFIVLHAVHVASVSKAQAALGSGKAIGGISALFAGAQEAITQPFNLAGTNLLQFLMYGGLMTAFAVGTIYLNEVERKLNYNEQWWKNHAHWFGKPTPLLAARSSFEVGEIVQEKNPDTGEMEDVFHSRIVRTDDWEGYNKYMISEYTDEDKKSGLPDMNFLIGRYPAGTTVKKEGFWNQLLGKTVPLTGDVKYSMDPGKTNRNLLTLVIGGSGKGKTFKDLEPNLAQMNCSFAITDPSGEIYENMGKMLLEDGYRVWRFSTSDPRYSNCYNPLDYIYDDEGNPDQVKVAQVVNIFIKNSQEAGKKGGDPFWTKSAIAWLTFAIMALVEFYPIQDRNFYQILKMAQQGKSDENSSSQSLLDQWVEAKKLKKPDAKCFEYYDIFAIAPAKTRNSIMISIGVDVSPFAQDQLRNLTTTSYLCKRDKKGFITDYILDSNKAPIPDSSNIDLRTIGDRKTALFIIPKTANDSYQFLVSIMYSQLFDILYERAEKVSKNSWHIYAKNGSVLTSQYKTKEEAEEWMKLYAGAQVKTVTEKGIDRYYIYNPEADKKHTMPEKRIGNKKDLGYIEEVFSEEVGNKMITQYQEAKVKHGKLRLPIHTRLLLDEFANISEIPNFEQFLSTMRKYQISCTIILQTIAQLKQKYDKSAPTIIGNCDTIMFLGSSDIETCKTISERLGKTVYKEVKTGQSKQGNGGSISMNYGVVEKDLMAPDALARLDNSKVITMITGLNPMMLDKLDFSKHPNWKKSGAYKDENKLLNEFTEAHYKCVAKIPARTSQNAAIETDSRNAQSSISPLNGKPIRKRPLRGTPVRTRKDLAQGLGVPEEKLDETLKNPVTIAPEDRHPDNHAVPNPTPANEMDFLDFGFTAPDDNNAPTPEPETAPDAVPVITQVVSNANSSDTSDTAPIAPNQDNSWIFM